MTDENAKKEWKELAKTFNLPIYRLLDKHWLLRNIPTNNKDNPQLNKAIELIKKL